MMKKIIFISVLISLVYFIDGTGMVGGVSQVTNDKDRNEYATKALQQLEKSSNNLHARKVIKITKVETQIVAGVKYTVTFTLALTDCKKGVNPDKLNFCKENIDSQREECEITIWEKPWMDFIELEKKSCKPMNNNDDGKSNEKENLPLFGTNMINHRRGLLAKNHSS